MSLGPDAMYSECERLVTLAEQIPHQFYQERRQIIAIIDTLSEELDFDGAPNWLQEQILEFLDTIIKTILEGGVVNPDE